MQTEIAITDLTRMKDGRVCIAGYTAERRCLRPVFRVGGLAESWLYCVRGVAIRPFAVVAFDVLAPAHQPPPHTEDAYIDPTYRVVQQMAMVERHKLLMSITEPSVEAIFGAPIICEEGCFVRAGEGTRSLGTVCADIEQVIYAPHPDRWEYTLIFTDAAGERWRMGIVDLALRNAFDYLRIRHEVAPGVVAERFMAAISEAEVYVRLGLSRGWAKHPDRCYLQITGIHTFPDYLKGKCFADFSLTG